MKYVTIFILSAVSINAIAKNFDCENYKNNENQCIAIESQDGFSSAFPIINQNKKYKWNYSKIHPEYSWKTELGFCINKNFIANDYYYILFSSNIHEDGKKGEGSLEELLRNKNINIIIEKSNRIQGVNDENMNKNPSIKSAVVPEGSMVLYSNDKNAKNILFKNEPTHAKLTAQTPDENDSYSCVVEIIKK